MTFIQSPDSLTTDVYSPEDFLYLKRIAFGDSTLTLALKRMKLPHDSSDLDRCRKYISIDLLPDSSAYRMKVYDAEEDRVVAMTDTLFQAINDVMSDERRSIGRTNEIVQQRSIDLLNAKCDSLTNLLMVFRKKYPDEMQWGKADASDLKDFNDRYSLIKSYRDQLMNLMELKEESELMATEVMQHYLILQPAKYAEMEVVNF
ncbi:MAG TPA: hypothetical protein VL651_01695 [Bacteroidia bacterium]|nr:hypothetical protein [Bacteroidia bacterium]